MTAMREGARTRLAPVESGARAALWLVLLLSWLVAVAYMWDAVVTVPSAERLAESKLAEIPSPRTFYTAAIFSAMEAAIVLAALWPGQVAFYATRLAVTALALITWFIMTTPMRALSRMDWVHRRWLGFMILSIVAALGILLIYRLIQRKGWTRT